MGKINLALYIYHVRKIHVFLFGVNNKVKHKQPQKFKLLFHHFGFKNQDSQHITTQTTINPTILYSAYVMSHEPSILVQI